MSIGALSTNDKIKLQSLINDGVQVMIDVANLKEGLKETVEAVADELDIKKNVLNKAIAIAFKRSQNKDKLTESREELDEVEQILMASGKA